MSARAPLVLAVDDDPAVTASLALLLKQAGYRSVTAASPAEAVERLDGVSLVLLDMNFSRRTTGEEGLSFLGELKAARPGLPVILMTAWGSISLAVAGVKAGAADFVTKPWTNGQLLQAIRTALGLAAASPVRESTSTREELDSRYDFGELLGSHPRVLRALELIGRVAGTDAPVLVTGESGTGKELVATALHRNSPRRGGPFVKVNLGGIPASLFESEMFGHVRGAFTDARSDRKGRFETADGGTIFLDEVGELESASQVKLLRVLQERTFEPLGSSVTRSADVRVVSATNRDLVDAVARGLFREDLLYRINLIAVHLPPLRERASDVPLLARRFLAEAGRRHGRDVLALSESGSSFLAAQPWPGNIRQLRQVVERAVLVSAEDTLTAADVEAALGMERGDAPRPPADPLPEVGRMTIDEMERAMIVKSIRHHAGNLSRVAESLGLSRAALYRRLEKYGIET